MDIFLPNREPYVAVGLRVVRGPDWAYDDLDGGEGHVGTVVGIQSKKVFVIWDNGYHHKCSIGFENRYDLCVVDSIYSGMIHQGVHCASCSFLFFKSTILGIRWKCNECRDYDLCNECYIKDKHETSHGFQRIDTSRSTGVEVPPRNRSRSLKMKGIFYGAEVVRAPDMVWDGHCEALLGNVSSITGMCHESRRSVAEVKWTSGLADFYWLGHRGKVDLKFTKASSGGSYYPCHLPTLGREYELIELGLRVVRGDDWKYGDQDGGEGYVGTVVEVLEDKIVRIQWDSGLTTDCRVGHENCYDLDVVDNASAGTKFEDFNCNSCKEDGIVGMRFRCKACSSYDLCTKCYMSDKHNLNHTFARFYEYYKDGHVMHERHGCKKVEMKGIFPNGEVVKCPGAAQSISERDKGRVTKTPWWDNAKQRSYLEIEWHTGSDGCYCFINEGRVHVKATKCSEGENYYPDHLAVLGAPVS